jgi:hypothetical protein
MQSNLYICLTVNIVDIDRVKEYSTSIIIPKTTLK